MCAACSIISVLTQWGATLVIKIRERERERERKGKCLVIEILSLQANTHNGVRGVFLFYALSLSLMLITRVAFHCVNTLMILHAAHTLIISAG